jgi:hypothetical protein
MQALKLSQSVCLCLFVFQNAHTAGVLAAYHGRRAVLEWLIEERGVKVWGGGPCGVCIECNPPRPHNDTIDVTATVHRSRHGGICPLQHKVPMYMSICDATIVGGDVETFALLQTYNSSDEAPPTTTRYFEADCIETPKLFKFACKWRQLGIAQRLHAQMAEEGLTSTPDWPPVRANLWHSLPKTRVSSRF